MKYQVCLMEVHAHYMTVEATSPEEALQKAQDGADGVIDVITEYDHTLEGDINSVDNSVMAWKDQNTERCEKSQLQHLVAYTTSNKYIAIRRKSAQCTCRIKRGATQMAYAAHVAEYYRIEAGRAYAKDRGSWQYRVCWNMYLVYARGGWV